MVTHQYVCVDDLSDSSVDWLPSQLYFFSPWCMHWHVISLILSVNALLQTSQIQGHWKLCMCMSYQGPLVLEWLITNCTGIRALTTMYALMSYQIALLTEWLTTNCTGIRTLTAMYKVMSYQIVLPNEWLTTHWTGIRLLTTMYALMCY